MSRYGWAYVSSVLSSTGAVASGPTGSLQFHSASQALSGSPNLIYDVSTGKLILTGTMIVSGTLQANEYYTNVVSASIIYQSGSTKFGDDAADTHQFTGSILGDIVSGTISRFTTITGSNITGTTAQLTTLSASYISASYIDFDTNLVAAPTFRTGRLFYNPDTGDLAYDTSITDVVLNIGQQTFVKVKNSSGAQINKGKLVFVSGGVGDNPLIYTASWDTDTTSARTIGMVMRNIANGDNGYVILNGVITGVDTAAYLGGTTLFLSSSGDYTSTRPTQPLHGVRIGEVVRSHATVGSIFVNIQNGFEVEELHDVLITTPSNGDLFVYDGSANLWKNTKALSGSYTVTSALTASSISASNALLTNITASSISSSGANSVFAFATFNNIAVTAGAVNATIGATTPSTGKFTTLSASSTLQVSGAITGTGGMNISSGTTTLGGNLTVNGGQTSVQSFTASAGISGSGALQIGGGGLIGGNLIVSGNTTLGDTSSDVTRINAQLTSSGGVVLSNAPFSFSYLNITTNFTMTTASCIIGVSASAPLTITLPSASTTTAGRYFIIKDEAGNSATNNITISCSVGSGDTLDNVSSSVINVNNGSYTIYRGGTNKYYIV